MFARTILHPGCWVPAACFALAGCTPAPPVGPAHGTTGGTTIGVVWSPPTKTALAKWSYKITDAGGFDHVTIDTDVPCNPGSASGLGPVSPGGTVPSATGAWSPAAGPAKSFAIDLIIGGVPQVFVNSATIDIFCDAANGGTASIGVFKSGRSTLGQPRTAALGPK